jgi:Tfp pilus assembly protein PilO
VAISTNPTKNMSNNNLIIIMLLVTLLVIGISAFIVNLLVRTIALDSKLVSKKLAAEKQLKENIVAAPNLIEAYRELGEERTLLEDALPTTADLPSLLVVLENMSKDATLALSGVAETAPVVAVAAPAPAAADTDATASDATATGTDTTGGTATTTGTAATTEPVSVTPKPETFAVAVTVKGSYAGLQTILDHIEKSARPMRLTGIQISGSPSQLDVTLSIETYYQKSSELPFGMETVK